MNTKTGMNILIQLSEPMGSNLISMYTINREHEKTEKKNKATPLVFLQQIV